MQNYPKDIKAFYMRINDDNKTVAAMDVLAPGIGEIGGSQREERLDVFDRRLAEMELSQEDYAWYRDLRRYGTVPHSGFGLGFERLVAYVTGMQNVRDVIPSHVHQVTLNINYSKAANLRPFFNRINNQALVVNCKSNWCNTTDCSMLGLLIHGSKTLKPVPGIQCEHCSLQVDVRFSSQGNAHVSRCGHQLVAIAAMA